MSNGNTSDFLFSMQHVDRPPQATRNNPRLATARRPVAASHSQPHDHGGGDAAHTSSFSPDLIQSRRELSYDEAVMRSLWLERYGSPIVLGFVLIFFMAWIILFVAVQIPGKSLAITIAEHLSQGIGGAMACTFLIWLLLRQMRLWWHFRGLLRQSVVTADTKALIHTEMRAIQSINLLWIMFTAGVCCALGRQLWWTYAYFSWQVRLPAFLDIYHLPLGAMYLFFYAAITLIARKHGIVNGRLRLVLDCLVITGATIALSWFFILEQTFTHLHGTPLLPSITAYFPLSDIVLVAVSAFCLCGLSVSEEQEKVFVRLFWGLCLLAFSDSLWSYQILHQESSLEIIRATTNPLGLLLIALAAIKYPQALFAERLRQPRQRSYGQQIQLSLRATSPFIIALIVCATLSTVVAARGGQTLLQAICCAFVLLAFLVARQALTLLENSRLARQLQHALLLSQQELSKTRQEIDLVAHEAQEKREIEDAIKTLRNAHAMLARGDFSARAVILSGPLLSIALSFNLMAERLSTLKQQAMSYEQLQQECQLLRTTVEQLSMGDTLVPVPKSSQKSPELGPIFLTLLYFQRQQRQQWHAQMQSLETIKMQVQYLAESVAELGTYSASSPTDRVTSGRLKGSFEHLMHLIEQLKQRIESLHTQCVTRDLRAIPNPIQATDKPPA